MCVHDCQHPLWRGSGFCQEAACFCDGDMSTTDSMGRASCVSRTALTAIYLILAGIGAASLLYFICAAIQQQQLRATRKAWLRLRVIYVVSCFAASALVVFVIAAARMAAAQESLYESGMLQALYTITLPLACSSTAYIGAAWLEVLPSQLLPADNIAVKVREYVQKNNIVDGMSLGTFISFAACGLSTFFVRDSLKVVRIINAASAALAFCMMICFTTVCFFLTRIIRTAAIRHVRIVVRAYGWAESSGADFYAKATRTLWIQVAALSLTDIVWIAAVVALEPQLGGIGAGTPIIPLSLMMMDAFGGLTLVVRLSSGGSSNGSNCPSTHVGLSRGMVIPGVGRVRAMFSSPRAELKQAASTSGAASKKDEPVPNSRAPRAASARLVVPTSGDAC